MSHPLFAVLAVAAIALAVGCQPALAQEKSLLERATPEQQKMFENLKPSVLKEAAQKPRLLADSKEDYFWVMSAQLVPLMQAYEYSRDPAFVEAFVPVMEQVLLQRYLHPTKPEWNGWFHYKGFGNIALIDHDAILYFTPALMFVKAVRTDAKLTEKYGAKADAWLKDVEISIRNWDKRGCWHDLGEKGGWYTNVPGYPDAKTGEIKPLGKEAEIYTSGQVPYNKIHALFQSLSLAAQITGDPWYKTRMEKCSKFFRAHWRVDDKHAEWNYRDLSFPGDYESGVVGQGKTRTGAFIHYKGGYYALDVEGVVRAWDVGAGFTKGDIEKLLQTNLEFMFMGDEKDPKFKMINGQYKAEEKYYKGYLWTALAHFSPKVRELWKTDLDRARAAKTWMWWSGDLEYLIEMSQPVSWDRRLVKAN